MKEKAGFDPRLERQQQLDAIMATLYLLSEGTPGKDVEESTLRTSLGYNDVLLGQRLDYLREKSLVRDTSAQCRAITHVGIKAAERGIVEVFVRGGDAGIKQRGFVQQFKLLKRLRYQRDITLSKAREIAGSDGGLIVHFRRLHEVSGLEKPVLFRSLEFFAEEDLIHFTENSFDPELSHATLKPEGMNYVTDLKFDLGDRTPEMLSEEEYGEFLESRWRPVGGTAQEKPSGAQTFPTPTGAQWRDVKIRFKGPERVSISVKNQKGVYNYTQMGMVDRRNSEPTKQWDLLRDFAEARGILDLTFGHLVRERQKRREILAGNLRAFFQIDEDPFEMTADGGGWKARFLIQPDE